MMKRFKIKKYSQKYGTNYNIGLYFVYQNEIHSDFESNIFITSEAECDVKEKFFILFLLKISFFCLKAHWLV